MGKRELSYRERLGFPVYEDPGIDCQRAIEEGRELIRVEEHHAEGQDINNILRKYSPSEKARILGVSNAVMGVYGDFSQLEGLQELSIRMEQAQKKFMELPAEVRREFDNDPEILVEAIDRSNNDKALYAKLQKLGILKVSVPAGGATQVAPASGSLDVIVPTDTNSVKKGEKA